MIDTILLAIPGIGAAYERGQLDALGKPITGRGVFVPPGVGDSIYQGGGAIVGDRVGGIVAPVIKAGQVAAFTGLVAILVYSVVRK